MFIMEFTDINNVNTYELKIFRAIENKFIYYFHCHFGKNDDINHCTEEDKLFLLNIIFNIEKYYIRLRSPTSTVFPLLRKNVGLISSVVETNMIELWQFYLLFIR